MFASLRWRRWSRGVTLAAMTNQQHQQQACVTAVGV